MPQTYIPGYVRRIWCITFFIFAACYTASGQGVNWQIHSPLPHTSIAINELFVSVSVDGNYTISSTTPVVVFLDGKRISGNLKVVKNKVHLLYPGRLYTGKHKIRIEAYIEELKKKEQVEWEFSVRSQNTDAGSVASSTLSNSAVSLSGTLMVDNRNEFLSGSGQSLRQEPDATRTVSLDAALKYKNAVMPIRLFATSNNVNTQQSMNYMQIGFMNRWLEVEAGDLNPVADQLVLSGVRLRGVRTMFKYRAHSLQLYYGQLNKAIEGSIENYVPGSGLLPTNLINDSQYVFSGTYKRMMMAARVETGNRSEVFKIGVNALKAKDDTGSIKYGIAPKDNIAGGMDATLKLFRKALIIQSGVAASVLTNDISNGVISKEGLDTTFNTKLEFEPKDYEKIIILNSSTVPALLDNTDVLSYFSKVNYNNKYQSFSFEYRKNGALYNSLGSPFFRNNYEGFSIGDRFSLYKKKFTIGLNYQDFSNNLNNSLPAKVYTKSYRANLFVYLKNTLPSLYLNYMRQNRNGESDYPTILGVDDVLSNYMINLGYSRKFWNINHHFSLMLNVNDRSDNLRLQNRFIAYNTMVSVTESFSEKYSVQASFGKTLISGANNVEITNLNVYSISFDWQIKPQKYFTSVSLSNTNTLARTLSNQSNRLSAIVKAGYRFYRGMELNVEGGYQPFRDQTMSANNYNESYVYIRYVSDLGMLFAK